MATIDIPQVQSFAYDNLQNDLHIGFGQDICKRIQNARWEDETRAKIVLPEKVDAEITPFIMAFQAEDRAYVIATGSVYTKQREEKHQHRIVLYREIKKTVDTFASLTIFTVKQQKAQLMKPVLDKYKVNPDGGIEAMTVALEQWLQEQETNYQLELAARELGLLDSITQLKNLNAEVRSLTSLRNDERAQQTLAALKSARTETELAYRSMILALNAAAIMDDSFYYGALIKGINETIKYYRQISEQRKRKNAAIREAQIAANKEKQGAKGSTPASGKSGTTASAVTDDTGDADSQSGADGSDDLTPGSSGSGTDSTSSAQSDGGGNGNEEGD